MNNRTLLVSDARTGSKFFLKKINAYLKNKYGNVAHLDWNSVHGINKTDNTDFMGLSEIFTNNYRYDRKQYELYEKFPNCFDFRKKTKDFFYDRKKELHDRLKILDNISLTFVSKIFYESISDLDKDENLLKFYDKKIDNIVLLTRSNLKEWSISRAILRNFFYHYNNDKSISYDNFVCSNEELAVESESTLNMLNEKRLAYYNHLKNIFPQKTFTVFDVSNLPSVININDMSIVNTNEIEFKNKHDYNLLWDNYKKRDNIIKTVN